MYLHWGHRLYEMKHTRAARRQCQTGAREKKIQRPTKVKTWWTIQFWLQVGGLGRKNMQRANIFNEWPATFFAYFLWRSSETMGSSSVSFGGGFTLLASCFLLSSWSWCGGSHLLVVPPCVFRACFLSACSCFTSAGRFAFTVCLTNKTKPQRLHSLKPTPGKQVAVNLHQLYP